MLLPKVVLVLLCTVLAHSEDTLPCAPPLAVDVTGGAQLPDGRWQGPDGLTYPVGLWNATEDGSRVLGCPCLIKPCLSKCCSLNKTHTPNEYSVCSLSNHSMATSFRPTAYHPGSFHNVFSYGQDHFYVRRGMECDEKIQLDGVEFYLTSEGKLAVPYECEVPLNPEQYCLDYSEDDDGLVAYACVYGAYMCKERADNPEDNGHFVVYGVFLLLSVPFFVATMVAYGMLPLTLHSKNLLSHIAAMTVSFFMQGVSNVAHRVVSADLEICTTFAFIIYFSFLASFFWLNVMCLDIFWTFSGFRPLRGSVKEREHKKFVLYSLYSWGCPLIMLTVALVMDLHPDIPNTYIKPGFGLDRCWFNERATPAGAPTLPYFYGPVGVLVVCNIILFIITAFKINKIKKETAMLKGADSKRHDDEDNKQRFSLYLKLFLVMGVNWIAEVISWAVGGPAYLWYITDIGNTLQGVLIFIIFVWKDRIRRLLMEKFFPNRVAASSASTTAQTSSTRASPSRNSTTRISQKKNSKGTNELIPMKTLVSDDSDVP